MDTLRTPDDRFVDLPDFDFAPHYVDVADGDGGRLRVHHLDEGPPDGEVVVLMHGEPSWCFLYRHMIPVLADAGLRCIAPDLVGFGRSDKPTEQSDYSYARHVEWMRAALLDAARPARRHAGRPGLGRPGRAARWRPRTPTASPASSWPTRVCRPATAPRPTRSWPGSASRRRPKTFRSGASSTAAARPTSRPTVIAAYDAPFPDDTYKAGARIFPTLVPTSPDDPAADTNRAAWDVLGRWDKPLLTAFSDARPHHPRRGAPVREAGAGRPGTAARHHRRRRPLPPGGRRTRAGEGGRRPGRGDATPLAPPASERSPLGTLCRRSMREGDISG